MNERDESESEEIAERRTEKQTNYGEGVKAQKRYRRERSEENQDRKMMKKKESDKTQLWNLERKQCLQTQLLSAAEEEEGKLCYLGVFAALRHLEWLVASATKTIFYGQRKISANKLFTTTVH